MTSPNPIIEYTRHAINVLNHLSLKADSDTVRYFITEAFSEVSNLNHELIQLINSTVSARMHKDELSRAKHDIARYFELIMHTSPVYHGCTHDIYNARTDNIITDDRCNTVYISERLRTHKTYTSNQSRIAKKLKSIFHNRYPLLELKNTKDVWVRDFMPLQLTKSSFLGFRYFPDYLVKEDRFSEITDYQNVVGIKSNLDAIKCDIIIDGGNIVKCDGYVIMTDKVFMERANIELGLNINILQQIIGTEVVIIPRDPEDPYGHADVMVRYVKPNVVLFRGYQDEEDRIFMEDVISKFHRQKPQVRIEQFNFIDIPLQKQHKMNWCYINFLRVGNIIVVPVLSGIDEVSGMWKDVLEDQIALNKIHTLFPTCDIYSINMSDFVKKGGGALNCLTWTVRCILD